ncbi:AAA family ATPase [Furfurilactobacillus sp. WILCCON 0119]
MAETFLDKYCRDLTVAAKEHPQAFMALEREQEVAMAVEILLRKTKNSPVLVGEAGVGKTAIVEELARRIALDQVPRDLRHKHILVLQTADLVGANPNDFMVNFNGVLHELQATLGTNILFVDEIHELIGTGAASDGSHLDAGNVLKPALARGEIQLIGATTNDEYHVSIEQDRALQRRFSMIPVLEPSRTAAIQIINGVFDQYAQYHDVTYAPDAVITAVDLSIRYRPDYDDGNQEPRNSFVDTTEWFDFRPC